LSTTISQGSVATRVNYRKIFNDFFIAHLLLSVKLKEFWRSVKIWQSYGKKYSGTFFPDTVYKRIQWRRRRSRLRTLFLPNGLWYFYKAFDTAFDTADFCNMTVWLV